MKKLIFSVLLFSKFVFSQDSVLEVATKYYNQGQYQNSLNLLEIYKDVELNIDNFGIVGEINYLIGQDYYMLGNFKKASDFLKKAADAEPKSANYQLWMGRAFGRRAENSSPLRAFDYAVKARQYFEKARELEPNNLDILGDLFDYYLRAPGFLGGGIKKAEDITKRVAKINRAEGHRFQGHLSEKKKKFKPAESNFREAIRMAPDQFNYRVDFAKFLSRQKRYTESEQLFNEAAKISPYNPDLLYERAESYIYEKRNLDVAQILLKEFLSQNLTPDNIPRYEAEKLLKKISNKNKPQ